MVVHFGRKKFLVIYKTNMTDTSQFDGYTPTWCPGCGDWGINAAVKRAFGELDLDPSGMIAIFGIGCSGNMNDFLNAYAMHSLHGRALPNAIGAKIANHHLPVVAIVGDGDCYGEGGNHFIHACRGNHDITVIVHDNGVYGLTTGQAAPTAQKGFKAKSTPGGIIEIPINPLTLAISSGATYVAQGFAGDIPHTVPLIKKGLAHKGFSLVNILQPCVTFNRVNTYQYYLQHTYKLNENYDPQNAPEAMKTAMGMSQEKFPLGVIFEDNSRASYTDCLPQLTDKTLVEKSRQTDLTILETDFR